MKNSTRKALAASGALLAVVLLLLWLLVWRKRGKVNKVGGFSATIEGYTTEYAVGADHKYSLQVNFTTPSSAGGAGDTLANISLYTVPCPEGTCPTLNKNPTDFNDNAKTYVLSPFIINSGDITKLSNKVVGVFPLTSAFKSGDSYNFGLAYTNSDGDMGDFIYLDKAVIVPSTNPSGVSVFTAQMG